MVKRFALIALYQPIVNGFSANLVAVQASRVSTWLWCSRFDSNATNQDEQNVIQKNKTNTSNLLASFLPPDFASNQLKVAKIAQVQMDKQDGFNLKYCLASVRQFLISMSHFLLYKLCWSFTNSSPNSIAARMLLIMLIPAHTIYFLVIWLLFSSSASATTIHLTWPFYLVYVSVCIIQVFILFLLCEPFMTLLMRRGHDPDIIGISILMALADLTGTLFLTGAFYALDALGDMNAR